MNKKNTLITGIKGGLGNHLFTYAASFGLANKFSRELIVDPISGYSNDPYGRVYLLDRFNIPVNQLSVDPFQGLLGRAKRLFSNRICEHLPHHLRWYSLDSIETHFHESEFAHYRSIYLDGYLQSDLYFKDHRQELLRELKITAPISPEVMKLARQIETEQNGVIVGVIRFKKVVNEPHVPTLDENFYKKCFEIMTSKLNAPKFYIVTGDEESARAEFTFSPFITFVSHIPQNERAHENLFLMRKATNFILTKSTYHLWGAWLSEDGGRNVLAPARGWIHPIQPPAKLSSI
jgi:hypothetical protein